MILFVDTSALLKLYVTEPGSDEMVALVHGASIGVSMLTYAEVHAAFARRQREGTLTADEYSAICRAFDEDWPKLKRFPLDQRTLSLVPTLCQEHPLRGGDAVQLATALMLRTRNLDVTMVCSDERLILVAAKKELSVINPSEPPINRQ